MSDGLKIIRTMVHILQVDSRKADLHAVALKILSLAVHIHLEPEWVPRELNERQVHVDYDDWY